MQHNAINQTELFHDVLSFNNEIDVHSPAGVELDHYDKHDVLLFDWYLVDGLQGTEEIAATWRNQTWVGVKAA